MSDLLCSLTTQVGALSYSWQCFKILKRREEIDSELSTYKRKSDDRAINLRVDAHLLRQEMKNVLKFWAVYAVLMIYEIYFELFFSWFPFYYTVKFVLCAWLVVPKAGGASVIFENLIEPQLDVVNEWMHDVGKPLGRRATLYVQSLLISSYVSLAISTGSDHHLKHVAIHLDELVKLVENEIDRRNAGHGTGGAISDSEDSDYEEEDFIIERASGAVHASQQRRPSWKESIAAWTSFSGPIVVEEGSNGLESNQAIVAPSNSDTWAKTAINGFLGLSMSTRDVLLGQRYSTESKHHHKSDEELTPNSFGKYSPGFDSLSDCEDSDPSSPKSTASSKQSGVSNKARSNSNTSHASIGSHQSQDSKKHRHHLRKRRPNTRSQQQAVQ